MKISQLIYAVLFIPLSVFSACNSNKTNEQNAEANPGSTNTKTSSEGELLAANAELYASLNSMFSGNLEHMNSIWSHGNYVTDMGPFGGRLTGWDEVESEFKKEAGMKLGGKIVCKDLHVYGGTDMGYTVCIEEGENMSAEGKQVLVSHRATNIFHLENGKWKLVHHQTDISPQLENAASGESK